MSKFEVGQTYSTRSACDHNCIIRATIVARTEKTVTASVGHKGTRTFRLRSYDGNEAFSPWGRGSMMPVIQSDDTRALKADWE
jgi:hypothetical protein